MKKFVNSAAYFSKHGANVAFRLLMAFFLLAAATTVYPSLIAFTPFVAAGVVAFYVFTVSFNGKRTEGMLSLTTQADIFNVTQLQIKDIVDQAIAQHFSGKEMPKLINKQIIRRRDIFDILYLTPGATNFKFFTAANKGVFSNLTDVSLPNNKMYVFFGIVAETATGAAAGDQPAILNFVSTVDEEVLNGKFTYKVNSKIRVEDTLYKTAFINDDAIKNYFRFPQPIVWEPSGQNELELALCAAIGAGVHKFQRMALLGVELVAE